MYWPVTAGGLGLRSALVLGGQYRQAMTDRKDQRHDAADDPPGGRAVRRYRVDGLL